MSDADTYKNLSVEDLAMLCAFKDDTIAILQAHIASKEVKAEIMTYCDVRLTSDGVPHGAPYTYLTGGLDLTVGDKVIVPVGHYHKERRAKVVAVYNFRPPLSSTIQYKTVHRKDNNV